MNRSRWGALVAVAFAASAPLAQSVHGEDGVVRVAPDEVQWRDLPGYSGMQGAVLDGDPRKPGVYVLRVKIPPGLMTRPHFHAEDRHITVISGTWWVGTGDSFDPAKAVAVKAGSYVKQPAGTHHFDGAKDEEVVLQIIGVGPGGTTFVRPADGPVRSSIESK
jgi:quercetin dioxygenase-like cupin family protein